MSVQLNRWLDKKKMNNPLRRVRGLLIVPAFTIAPTWNGSYSVRAIQFNYSIPRNLGLKVTKSGNYIVDTLGVLELSTDLCWCIKNIVEQGGNTEIVPLRVDNSGDTTYTWLNLDINKKYRLILKHNGTNIKSHSFTGVNTIALETVAFTASVFVNGVSTFSYATSINGYSFVEYPENVVLRYKLNTSNEVLTDTPLYSGQAMFGSFISLEGWTTASCDGSNVVQPSISLNSSVLGDLDNRFGNDYSLGTYTAEVTSFAQSNPNSVDLFNLPLTYTPTLINGLAT